MKRGAPKPSPAMIVALLALFVSLGGSAYAIGRNSIGTQQLKNGSVTTQKLKPGAVTGSRLAGNSVTLSKIEASDRKVLERPLAFGLVRNVAPYLANSGKRNVEAVTSPALGVYCVQLTSAATAVAFPGDAVLPAVSPLAAVEWSGTGAANDPNAQFAYAGTPNPCPAKTLHFVTEAPYGTPSPAVSFTFIVP